MTEIIGVILGAVVMIDRASRSVIIAHKDMAPVEFSIDHPYIQGTKLERDARAALDAVRGHWTTELARVQDMIDLIPPKTH